MTGIGFYVNFGRFVFPTDKAPPGSPDAKQGQHEGTAAQELMIDAGDAFSRLPLPPEAEPGPINDKE